MSARRFVWATVLAGALLAVSPTAATTIAPPRDLGELLRMSDAVVYAEAAQSWSEAGRSVPLTVTRFLAVRSIAGASLPWTFDVEELGGDVGDVSFAVAGSPRYREGQRYLLFLGGAPNLRWRSRIMAYGLLVEDRAHGALRPLPEAAGLTVARGGEGYEPPAVYRRDALLDHLESVAKGARWEAAKVRDIQAAWEEIHDDPANCDWLLSISDNLPFRRFGFDTGGTLTIAPTTPGQTGIADGGVGAVQAAVAAWSNDAGSNIAYLAGGTQVRAISCTGFTDVAQGQAIFDDPCNDIPDLSGCNGTLGFGGAFSGGPTQTFRGEQWHPITNPYMVVNNGAACVGTTGFNEMMAHELGHSLGFGHHTDPNALMDGTLHNPPVGPILQTTDQACAAYAYPDNSSGKAVVRRQELAALLLRAGFGAGYSPPCNTAPFSDVVCGTTPYANYINDLKARPITAGCNADGTLYCPLDAVTREQGAMLWLKTLSISPGACNDVSAPTGYTDINCADPFGAWVREMRIRGYTEGCTADHTRFCPQDALTRDELAAFITAAGFPAPPNSP